MLSWVITTEYFDAILSGPVYRGVRTSTAKYSQGLILNGLETPIEASRFHGFQARVAPVLGTSRGKNLRLVY